MDIGHAGLQFIGSFLRKCIGFRRFFGGADRGSFTGLSIGFLPEGFVRLANMTYPSGIRSEANTRPEIMDSFIGFQSLFFWNSI